LLWQVIEEVAHVHRLFAVGAGGDHSDLRPSFARDEVEVFFRLLRQLVIVTEPPGLG
jgi:hypothetical protein